MTVTVKVKGNVCAYEKNVEFGDTVVPEPKPLSVNRKRPSEYDSRNNSCSHTHYDIQPLPLILIYVHCSLYAVLLRYRQWNRLYYMK